MPGREKEDDRGGPLVGDREQGRWSGPHLGQDVGGLRPLGGLRWPGEKTREHGQT
jgi:hypothetical protein